MVVDDRLEMAELVADALGERGYDAFAVASGEEALRRMQDEGFDALVTDLRMPRVDGLELLAASRRLAPERPVLVMTAYGAIDSAVEAIRQGAYYYLTKPFKMEELAIYVGRALEEAGVRREARSLRHTLTERYGPSGIVSASQAMQRVLEVVHRVAPTDVPLLLLGETGTGKGLLARTLHTLSPRSARPFVTVNCAALPEALLESELFGHVRGAFTGATTDRPGLFVEADGGTLFLDEIGEMSPALQAKLLHALEMGRVRPVGAGREKTVDVRLVSATHRDLRERIAQGSFREDLLYRLEVVSVEIPPLRLRREDIPALLEHFLAEARARHTSAKVRELSADLVAFLLEYRWPGNVRELAHLVERLVVLGTMERAGLDGLPASVRTQAEEGAIRFVGDPVPVHELHHRYAMWVLERNGGNKNRTADRMQIDVKTLGKWLSDGAP
jgi:two-component system response regulator HydG